MNIKFFDETFKILLAITACAWLLYLLFVMFAGDNDGCVSTNFDWVNGAMALMAGILTAPPLVYGVVRLLFWPDEPKNESVWVAGWILGFGVAVFVTLATLFALGLAQYGCN